MSTTPREPLLSDEDVQRIALGYFTPEYVQKSRVAQDLYNASYVAIHKALEICEAARAKDAELIQRLVDGLEHAQILRDKRLYSIDSDLKAAAAAGFKPNEP